MSGGWIWSPSSSPGSEAGVVTRLGDERGVALILGLVVLMTLSALALAFLAVSALEPRISRNLHDASRARWLAEAGIELGYGLLAATADGDGAWSAFMTASTADAPWVDLPSLERAVLPGLTPTEGTRSEEHTSELQSLTNLVCRLLLEKKKKKTQIYKRHKRRQTSQSDTT